MGASKFAFEVLPYLGSNGVFVFTGVPRGEKPMEIDTERIMYNLVLKNQVMLGTVNAGPLAFDNAVSLAAAKEKGIISEVAGRADILVVPDLEAGNMLAKQLTFIAGADAAGIVLGARIPTMDIWPVKPPHKIVAVTLVAPAGRCRSHGTAPACGPLQGEDR